jgi:hypothetical protein
MTVAFGVVAVLVNVFLRNGKQAWRILEESAVGRCGTVVELLVTVAFGSSVCSNSICYLIEVHQGKRRQHLMSIFIAFMGTLSGGLNIAGLAPTYYNEAAGWTYVSSLSRASRGGPPLVSQPGC